MDDFISWFYVLIAAIAIIVTILWLWFMIRVESLLSDIHAHSERMLYLLEFITDRMEETKEEE